MAATLVQLEARRDALDKAIHSGVLTVRDASGTMTTFRSMAEMLAARNDIDKQIADLGATSRSRVRYLHQAGKGL